MLKLKEIRLKQNLSVPKLAEKTGLHRRTIQDIEARGDCMLSTAYLLAQALGVTLCDLYTGPESDEKTAQK